MEAFRAALDGAWDWAERRAVRLDFWRNDDHRWEAVATLRDHYGEFSESVVIPLPVLTGALRDPRQTRQEIMAEYTHKLRHILDGAVSAARAKRYVENQRRGK